MTIRLIIFLVLNFGALAIGSFFTSKGVPSEWYAELNKAPWTPPGWMFGFAWTTIMICFSLYLAYLWPLEENKSFLIGLFLVQLLLNIGWNPMFFYYHNMLGGLIIITALTGVMWYFLFHYWDLLKWKTILVAPYCIWLVIATSLNAYTVLKN